MFFILFFIVPLVHADELYNSFQNPPSAARPFVRWDWPVKLPADKEIIKQLETFKNSGFGGVEIAPAEITLAAAKSLKFASDEAKKHELLVDLSLPWPPTTPSLRQDECTRTISLDKKFLKGPMQFHTDINDLNSKLKTQNSKLMFLRLIPLDLKRFTSGDEFIGKIQPNGSIDFNIPDGNYVFYIGVLNQQSAIGNQSLTPSISGQSKNTSIIFPPRLPRRSAETSATPFTRFPSINSTLPGRTGRAISVSNSSNAAATTLLPACPYFSTTTSPATKLILTKPSPEPATISTRHSPNCLMSVFLRLLTISVGATPSLPD